MSNLWPKYNKQNLCPHCQHGDWLCRYGDTMGICMRVESEYPAKDGGWYHPLDNSKPKPIYHAPSKPAPKAVDCQKEMDSLWFDSDYPPIDLSKELSVSSDCLWQLGFCWSMKHQAWACPMRDGDNKIIGIHLRCEDGSKKAITGSRNGLFIPQIPNQKIAYVCEGASNTASLLTMGFWAVGRPSCNTGGDMLKVLFKRLGINRVVYVADNDCIKVGGKRPGYEGAVKLKKELGLSSVLITPPTVKDIRELLNKVGVDSARSIINEAVSSRVWGKS